MAKYIKKDTALRAICDGCAQNCTVDDRCIEYVNINAVPEIEVVFCSECKHSYGEGNFMGQIGVWHCNINGKRTSGAHFCSYGKRRTE